MKPDSYELKRRIGVVMQNVAVFDELTVYENIDYFCGLYIKDKALRKQYVEEAIAFVELGDYKKFYEEYENYIDESAKEKLERKIADTKSVTAESFECLNPKFDKLDKDFREQHTTIIVQSTEPTGGQQLWLQTQTFESAVTDDYQL